MYIPTDPSRQLSTLDFFLTNIAHNLAAVKVINELSSDHLPISTIVDFRANVNNLQYVFNKTNWQRFKTSVNRNLPSSIDIAEITNQIDEMLETFNEAVKKGIDESTPKQRINPVVKMLPNYIKIMIKFRRNWKRYRDVDDHRQILWLNKEICTETNKFRHLNWNNMLITMEKSSTPFWKVSKVLKRKTSIPTLKDNNLVSYTQQEKADMLAKCFMSNNNISSHLSDVKLHCKSIRQILCK
ncbi:hypothetical protein CVS40_5814 [Lucilia cuprina]|nr:hypothetical protein CVS40_5814 [Lucilia cuprina]